MAVLGKNPAGPLYIDTELALLLAGCGIYMCLGVDVRVYTQGGLCFLACFFRNRDKIFQLGFGLYMPAVRASEISLSVLPTPA